MNLAVISDDDYGARDIAIYGWGFYQHSIHSEISQ